MSDKQACTQQQYKVTTADLPLSCPMAGMMTWDAHPRVYLDTACSGQVVCPYCGTTYLLKAADSVA